VKEPDTDKPIFRHYEHWTKVNFKSTMKILEKLLQQKDPQITVKIKEWGIIHAEIEKRGLSYSKTISIIPYDEIRDNSGYYGAIIGSQAFTIKYKVYSNKESKRIYAKNPNVLLNEISNISSVLNSRFRENQMEEFKEQEWDKTMKELKGEKSNYCLRMPIGYDELKMKVGDLIITKHDKEEVKPTSFNLLLDGISKTNLKEIIDLLNKQHKNSNTEQ